jgi:DNA-binding MarR family transcriptional regulator
MDKPERALLQQLGRTSRAMYAAFEAEVGQPLPRWRILQALRAAQCTSQKQLADQLAMDPGALTRLLKSLEADGLITRVGDPTDNRVLSVALSPGGRELIDSAQPLREAFSAKALEGLPADDLVTAMTVLQSLETRFRGMKGS